MHRPIPRHPQPAASRIRIPSRRLIATPLLLMALFAVAWATPAPAPGITRARILRGSDDYATFNQPLGMAADIPHRELYVANSGFGRIDVYSFTGRSKAQYPHYVMGPDSQRVLGMPVALSVDARGRVYVVDARDPGVDVIDYRARPLGRLDVADPAHPTRRPCAVAVAPDGRILVATDGDSGRIHVFGADLQPLASWGEPGAGPGRLSFISAITVGPGGEVVITRNDDAPSVQVFTLDGRYLRGFGDLANGPGNFAMPTGVAVGRDGRIWVVDQIRQAVQVFDSTGAFLGVVGDYGVGPGRVNYPHAITTTSDSSFAISERLGARVQLWSVQ